MAQHDWHKSLEGLSPEVLREGFGLLYEEYKKGGAPAQESAVPERSSEPDIPNFVALIHYLKGKYDFEELRDLSIEGGRVFFRRGGRKIELSREQEDFSPPPVSPSREESGDTGRFSQLELN